MWCTRWFLAMLLLPVPKASPYFLAVFFLSITLQSRPCMYCVIFLIAFFASTCYWQPLLSTTPLSHASGNITTFLDVILSTPPSKSFSIVNPNSSLSSSSSTQSISVLIQTDEVEIDEMDLKSLNLNISATSINTSHSSSSSDITSTSTTNASINPSQKLSLTLPIPIPQTIQLLDHCWCDIFQKSGFFEPFDIDAWERESAMVEFRRAVEKEKGRVLGLLSEKRRKRQEKEGSQGQKPLGSNSSEEKSANSSRGKDGLGGLGQDGNEQNGEQDENGTGGGFSFKKLRTFVFPGSTRKYQLKPASVDSQVSSSPGKGEESGERTVVYSKLDGSDITAKGSRDAEPLSTLTKHSLSPAQNALNQNDQKYYHPLSDDHAPSESTNSNDLNTPIVSSTLLNDSNASSQKQNQRGPKRKGKWLRRHYDLRPYGLDITLDFGWGKS